MRKKYPTEEQIKKATQKMLKHWLMYLPSPLTEEEKKIINIIKRKK
jgi:hypothetical protein